MFKRITHNVTKVELEMHISRVELSALAGLECIKCLTLAGYGGKSLVVSVAYSSPVIMLQLNMICQRYLANHNTKVDSLLIFFFETNSKIIRSRDM